MSDQAMQDWIKLRDKAGPFPPLAYQFIHAGLQHTAKMVHGELQCAPDLCEGESRHITGQQLCMGLRDFALKQYGKLARIVLHNWHIHSTMDFGRMVFAMIDAELMRKQDDDTLEDFQGVFDFDEAFGDLELTLGDQSRN